MKKIVILILLFCATTSYSQDTVKMRQIDSLVKIINQSSESMQQDSVVSDHPEYGLKTRNYLTTLVSDGKLKKYVNKAYLTTVKNGVEELLITENAFYFDQNALIKVEEWGMKADKKQEMDWYFSENKLLYNTFQSEKSEDRAALLLQMGNSFLKILQK